MKLKKNLWKEKKWMYFSLFFFLFFLLLAFVWFRKDLYLDSKIYEWISSFQSDRMTSFFKILTSFGNPLFFVLITLFLFVLIPDRKMAKNICFNIILITITNNIIKLLVSRPRPIGIGMIEESGYSFPSAHAMVSVAFYGLLIFYLQLYGKKKWVRKGMPIFLSVFVFLICISRIYLGVHYASDVFAGIFLSLSYLIFYTHILKKKLLKSENSCDTMKQKDV